MMADRVKDGTDELRREKISTGSVRARTRKAKESVSHAYSKARETTSATYERARTRAARGRAYASETLEDNAVAALIGGLALGALVGALLPRSRREAELLSPVGERINETTKRVAGAARDSARDTIESYGLNANAAIEKVDSLFENAAKAATSIGSAARGALQKEH